MKKSGRPVLSGLTMACILLLLFTSAAVHAATEQIKAALAESETLESLLIPGVLTTEDGQQIFIADQPADIDRDGKHLSMNRFIITESLPEELINTHILIKPRQLTADDHAGYLTVSFAAGDEIVIPTSCGFLRYPAQWVELLEVTIPEDAEMYRVEISCRSQGNRIPLFSVSFQSGNGELIGTYEREDQNVQVYLKPYVLPEQADDAVYAMADDVNYLIEALNRV